MAPLFQLDSVMRASRQGFFCLAWHRACRGGSAAVKCGVGVACCPDCQSSQHRDYVGHNCTCHDYIGHNYIDHDCMGHACTGRYCICHNYLGHNCIGHDSICHFGMGHSHISQTYVGHDYIGLKYMIGSMYLVHQVVRPQQSPGLPRADIDMALYSYDLYSICWMCPVLVRPMKLMPLELRSV